MPVQSLLRELMLAPEQQLSGGASGSVVLLIPVVTPWEIVTTDNGENQENSSPSSSLTWSSGGKVPSGAGFPAFGLAR